MRLVCARFEPCDDFSVLVSMMSERCAAGVNLKRNSLITQIQTEAVRKCFLIKLTVRFLLMHKIYKFITLGTRKLLIV